MENTLYVTLFALLSVGGFSFGWWLTGLALKEKSEQQTTAAAKANPEEKS